MEDLDRFSKEELKKLVQVYAKNWIAHDGCWFLAIEEAEGLERAIEYDKRSWERFTRIEAKRIMKEFEIAPNLGLDGLEKALQYRLYAMLNKDKIERISENKLIYKMVSCRVQSARERKGLPLFPCKPVGIVEYSGFAETIDHRIKTTCIAAPPDTLERSFHCGWEFTIEESSEEE